MNQKTIFTIIASLLVLQGLGIFIMSDQIVSQSFSGLTEQGIRAAAEMATVVAILYVSIGVITFYVRESPEVLVAYVIGFVLIVLNTSRHIFISEMNVPLPLFLMQILFLLACVFLLVKLKRSEA
ncbi:MAG: hypothetical protein ABJO02_18005 [Reichenbachiella sp.]|uniref:hypothetical protein n=1 Tax=Reichenbachiella sp. TaxID=2184521 RepID=UPI003298C0D9